MLCGVKFCGGCNPRYDRAQAVEKLKSRFDEKVVFANAEENIPYGALLVVGGCTNCCASYGQYEYGGGVIKMWDESHVEKAFIEIGNRLTEDRKSGLEENLQ